jgi:hypothetical protein
MEELIEQATDENDVFGPFIRERHYDLIGLDGNIVLPSLWEQSVEPGWSLRMRMRKDAEDAKRELEAAMERKIRDEAKARAEEEERRASGKDKLPIRFKDAVGRKFNFPFHACNTWPVSHRIIIH